jgi:hypothetical protein
VPEELGFGPDEILPKPKRRDTQADRRREQVQAPFENEEVEAKKAPKPQADRTNEGDQFSQFVLFPTRPCFE